MKIHAVAVATMMGNILRHGSLPVGEVRATV